VFDNTPCRLIGERQRGLIAYVMALMNGARVDIAAQSLGVAEAAYRLGRTYAHTRCQFGGPIERLPAVAELVTDMKVDIEAARALTYETARVCDLENNNLRLLELGPPLPKDEEKRRKQLSRSLKRLNGMLTPMSKYYSSEMCNRVAYNTIQILGGSGYMKDYAAERYYRDARITNIYEGTSQLQVVAAVRGVTSGALDTWCEQYEAKSYNDALLDDLKAKLVEAHGKVNEMVQFVKTKGNSYLDLSSRRLVDGAVLIIIGHLLIGQGVVDERKKRIARRFITRELHVLQANLNQVLSGDASPTEEYQLLAGPVPANE
jgi:3-(methylthio)propanoyl-CoA dehydrogenase